MARAPVEQLEAVARLAGEGAGGPAEMAALHRALEEYLPRRRQPIAPLGISVDGEPVGSLYAAISDGDRTFEHLTLRRAGATPPASHWEFLRPFDTITLREDGSGEVRRGEAASTRVMSRLLLREHHQPPPGAPGAEGSKPVPPELFTPPAFAQYIRATGVVPFAVALAVYFPDERVRYEVDLVDSTLLLDPRTDRVPVGRRVARPTRVGYAVDAVVARGELSLPSARALESVVESNGLSAMDLAPLYGGVRELGASALDSLVLRDLVSFDRRTGLYRARLESLGASPGRGRGRAEPVRSRPNPRLRTSVMELLAAAESRATCPLCGAPLPPGFRGILCANCQALVGEGGSTAPSA